MEVNEIELCTCEESEIDKNLSNYMFYLCKKCKKAVKRKEHICAYYLLNGYCELAEKNNYTLPCKLGGLFSECKSGHTQGKEHYDK